MQRKTSHHDSNASIGSIRAICPPSRAARVGCLAALAAAAHLLSAQIAQAGWAYDPANSTSQIMFDPTPGGPGGEVITPVAVGGAWYNPSFLPLGPNTMPGPNGSFNKYGTAIVHYVIPTGVNTASVGLNFPQATHLLQKDPAPGVNLPMEELRIDFKVELVSVGGFFLMGLPGGYNLVYVCPPLSTGEFHALVNFTDANTGAVLLPAQSMNFNVPVGAGIAPLSFPSNGAVWVPNGVRVRVSGYIQWKVDVVGGGLNDASDEMSLELDQSTGDNDNCQNAQFIGAGNTAFDTTNAATDGPVQTYCGYNGEFHNDVWFKFISTFSGTLRLTTCEQLGGSADYDSDIAVYDGVADCSSLGSALMACNDDDPNHACGTAAGGYHSTLEIPVTQGATYIIRVGGYQEGTVGAGVLHLEKLVPPCPADINGNGAVNVDDLLALINAWGPCPSGNCPADIAPPGGNGIVNVDDLIKIINSWGACPQ